MLLQKPRSFLETYNDLSGDVVNFFRVLRDRPNDLVRKIELTPWARAELELHYKPTEDPIEAARRFWVGCTMLIQGMAFTSSGMRMIKGASPGIPPVNMTIDHLFKVASRFKHVQIENKSYDEVIQMYDYPDNLLYLDPPYTTSKRTHSNVYLNEWAEEDHTKAADLLCQIQSFVIISGYACRLYAELYENHGWRRVDKEAQTNSGGKRIESLWLSPRTWEALQRPQQLVLGLDGDE